MAGGVFGFLTVVGGVAKTEQLRLDATQDAMKSREILRRHVRLQSVDQSQHSLQPLAHVTAATPPVQPRVLSS